MTTMTGNAYSVFDRSLLASNDALHAAVKAKTEAATSKLLDEGFDLSPWFVPKGYGIRGGSPR